VGLVLQDPFIFTDTVEENIRMRDFSLSLDTVHEAGRTVGADAFIQRLPDGYATVLAERGANLSTGQKQLVALARVAAFNPQIVLVMDEATASVDPETEATLQRSIQRVMEGRTSIVIAHHLRSIRHADVIFVVKGAGIVEHGTHEALLARGGVYSELYGLQV
jgi:ATP-binding cassette subfamily B protein